MHHCDWSFFRFCISNLMLEMLTQLKWTSMPGQRYHDFGLFAVLNLLWINDREKQHIKDIN